MAHSRLSHLQGIAVAWLCLGLSGTFGWCAEQSADPVDQAFAIADKNGDKLLSQGEYLTRPGKKEVLRRDFGLFDFNGDEQLSRREFESIPGISPNRGPIPDPFDDLLAQAVDALDQAHNEWNLRPEVSVDTQTFVLSFLRSLSPNSANQLNQDLLNQADPDGSGSVSRDEARRFLQLQLGMVWTTGDIIRRPNGRFVQLRHFMYMDENRDNAVVRQEFIDRWSRANPEEAFEAGDQNKDGKITLNEYGRPDWIGQDDPILWFMSSDVNLDGLIDARELEAATPNFRKTLVPQMFPAFDSDGDGKLSLNEYRLTPHGFGINFWERVQTDNNSDGELSFEEFTFDKGQFALLRRLYFHRFDANGDGVLTYDEYAFKKKPPVAFHLLAVDGSETRPIYGDDTYASCGSPAVSPDGQQILFDTYRGKEGLQGSRIMLMTIDGKDAKDICAGLMPTWSKDGKQFACSRYEGGSGVWIINIDGGGEKRIGDGWGAQWSPDGKTVAYTRSNEIWAYDVESGQNRAVLSGNESPYRYIYWNPCWSPDSKRLLFKADKVGGAEIASINMVGDDRDLKVHLTPDKEVDADVGWSADGSKIRLSMIGPARPDMALYELDATKDAPPKLVAGQDAGFRYTGSTKTPDGKWIVAVAHKR